MVNDAYAFSQSEWGKYFEWIIMGIFKCWCHVGDKHKDCSLGKICLFDAQLNLRLEYIFVIQGKHMIIYIDLGNHKYTTRGER